eukprot:2236346-Amphidinium_carterae.1
MGMVARPYTSRGAILPGCSLAAAIMKLSLHLLWIALETWTQDLVYWPYNVVDDITVLFAGKHPRDLIERIVFCVRSMVEWLTREGH